MTMITLYDQDARQPLGDRLDDDGWRCYSVVADQHGRIWTRRLEGVDVYREVPGCCGDVDLEYDHEEIIFDDIEEFDPTLWDDDDVLAMAVKYVEHFGPPIDGELVADINARKYTDTVEDWILSLTKKHE